jgi:HlyD family secretion protein
MEARVKVDETEVVKIDIGQLAEVTIDAFPDSTFTGHVTEIGNSPIYTSAGASQQAVDFEVKVTLAEHIPNIRPGLSCKAEIETARRAAAIAVPLGAVTVRKWPPEPKFDRRQRGRRRAERRAEATTTEATTTEAATTEVTKAEAAVETATATTTSTDNASGSQAKAPDSTEIEREDKEGVFVVEDGIASFRPVTIGVTGEEDFEVLSGLEVDETVVTGPFRILRELEDGEAVKEGKQQREQGNE